MSDSSDSKDGLLVKWWRDIESYTFASTVEKLAEKCKAVVEKGEKALFLGFAFCLGFGTACIIGNGVHIEAYRCGTAAVTALSAVRLKIGQWAAGLNTSINRSLSWSSVELIPLWEKSLPNMDRESYKWLFPVEHFQPSKIEEETHRFCRTICRQCATKRDHTAIVTLKWHSCETPGVDVIICDLAAAIIKCANCSTLHVYEYAAADSIEPSDMYDENGERMSDSSDEGRQVLQYETRSDVVSFLPLPVTAHTTPTTIRSVDVNGEENRSCSCCERQQKDMQPIHTIYADVEAVYQFRFFKGVEHLEIARCRNCGVLKAYKWDSWRHSVKAFPLVPLMSFVALFLLQARK